ncbi:hypothetical protein LEP1GSC016_3130 [Leptospira borgpetersenii serovar Hardjo-bovis str. Sponselee]|uniref:Uncharacterized protein n=1 Tax=Leptospira borgpetersenii serovar Hardjo-bovis str. Sponselee TaxID=1303729 RepID=M6BVN3_LEPBO|nr:hypothetical protein LBK6_01875 [Leptospira borgpetersenii serovar Hardjo]AWV69096.1 hypothetical protein B9T54_02025 [Leptospira borgpetersenii serovar Hardjo-bovis]EMJ77895.1 hypothetical protein LEP1GSC016_3130 [Leptospira borgpetersenii serovar Hardjo-bovis str. Sponselee]AMX60418.1 hypothetical protein LBK9_01870 [Leptospira borgpetersenii serovar Hardjo]AMX63665.1 hypothetical protein LBK30_01890 [Leptospira borgpetersenii serovar Hardjo]
MNRYFKNFRNHSEIILNVRVVEKKLILCPFCFCFIEMDVRSGFVKPNHGIFQQLYYIKPFENG